MWSLQNQLNKPGHQHRPEHTPELSLIGDRNDFRTLSGLVIPRGSSLFYSTKLFEAPLYEKIISFTDSGRPLLVTCGSMVVFMKEFGAGCENRRSFRLINARIDNGVFNGRHAVLLHNRAVVSGDFSDAPRIYDLGEGATETARLGNEIVGVKQDRGGQGPIFAFSYLDVAGNSYADFLRAIQ